jgi:hypothetical protein
VSRSRQGVVGLVLVTLVAVVRGLSGGSKSAGEGPVSSKDDGELGDSLIRRG